MSIQRRPDTGLIEFRINLCDREGGINNRCMTCYK